MPGPKEQMAENIARRQAYEEGAGVRILGRVICKEDLQAGGVHRIGPVAANLLRVEYCDFIGIPEKEA